MEIEIKVKYYFTLTKMVLVKKTKSNKHCGEIRTTTALLVGI